MVAFRTIGLPVSVHIREDVESRSHQRAFGHFRRIGREVATQFPSLPEDTIVACVGPHTHEETVAAGLKHQPHGKALAQKRALIETVESAIDQSDMLD